MIEVPLTKGWSMKLNLTELREWCRLNLILEDDWEFVWQDLHGDVNAIVKFENDNDALAFRLKFGI